MKHQIKTDKEGSQFTSVVLAGGTKLKLGNVDVVLPKDTEICLDGAHSYDAVVETIYASGGENVVANKDSFAYVEERENGKVNVTYGGRGQRIETAVVEEAKAEKPKSQKPSNPKKAAPKKK